jgi:hypothetical protein
MCHIVQAKMSQKPDVATSIARSSGKSCDGIGSVSSPSRSNSRISGKASAKTLQIQVHYLGPSNSAQLDVQSFTPELAP